MKLFFSFLLLFIYNLSAYTLNDSDYILDRQWSLEKIKADTAWNIVYNKNINDTIIIAIIDTGIDTNHIEFKNKLFVNEAELNGTKGIDDDANGYIDDIYGFDFIDGSYDSQTSIWTNSVNGMTDLKNHGTLAAGIIAAASNNDTFISGIILKNVLILPIKALDNNLNSSTEVITAAINYAVKMNAKIININYTTSIYNSELEAAINNAYEKGCFIVSPVGDNNSKIDDNPVYPASLSNVFSVVASNSADEKYSNSNYGWNIDLTAPGVNILSTDNSNNVSYSSGSYLSAAITTGAAGLILQSRNDISNSNIKDILINSADDIGSAGHDDVFGNGRLNLLNAIRLSQVYVSNQTFNSKFEIINYPNPLKIGGSVMFDPTITVSTLEIYIYNMNGKMIKKLENISDFDGDGGLEAKWDGKDKNNNYVSSGTYLFIAKSDNEKYKNLLTVINW